MFILYMILAIWFLLVMDCLIAVFGWSIIDGFRSAKGIVDEYLKWRKEQ